MSEWQRVKFEDLLVGKKISYGVVQPGQFQEVGGVPLIRVNNIKNAKVDVSDIVKIHEDVEPNTLRHVSLVANCLSQ